MNSPRGVQVAAVLLLFLATDLASADMGVPGFKRIERRVRFENLGDYPTYAFFLTPFFSRDPKEDAIALHYHFPIRLDSGRIYSLGHAIRFRTRWILVAIPILQLETAGEPFDWKILASHNPGVLHSDIVVIPDYETSLLIYPSAFVLHHFRAEISDDKLTVEATTVEDVSFTVGSICVPSWLVGLFMMAAVAWLGIWWVRRRRTRGSASASARSARLVRAPEK